MQVLKFDSLKKRYNCLQENVHYFVVVVYDSYTALHWAANLWDSRSIPVGNFSNWASMLIECFGQKDNKIWTRKQLKTFFSSNSQIMFATYPEIKRFSLITCSV